MAARLESKWLGTNIASLAVSGGGAETGLQLVHLMQPRPKFIIVELNVFFRPEDDEVIDYFSGSPLAQLRRRIPPAWQFNHPVNLIFSFLQSIKKPSREARDSDSLPNRSSPSFQIALKHQLEHSAHEPDSREVQARCNALDAWMENFRKSGSEIVLSWFPMDPSIAASPYYSAWFKAFHTKFPASKCRWITFPESLGEHTTDGVHLDSSAAREAAQWLAQNLVPSR